MNLRHLSDDNLIASTDRLVSKEREILSELLHHFREIERRRLYSSHQCESLFDYCIKKYGYSEDQAYRRIAAMRLLKDLPELEEKLNSGSLNLSHLNLAQSFFKKETHTKAEKLELLNQLENRPIRQAQKIVLSQSSQPEALIPDKSRQLTEDLTELKFAINDNLKNKVARVKGLFAHTHPNMTMSDLLDQLCDIAIESKTATFRKRCVTKHKKEECENCHSIYALEVDHIIPRAKGGTDDQENLRTLCRSCNQRAAIKEFGLHKMSNYLDH